MLTRRDKMVVGTIAAVVILFCVSVSFGKAEKGGRSKNRGQQPSAKQDSGTRVTRNANQSFVQRQGVVSNQTQPVVTQTNSPAVQKREVAAARTKTLNPAKRSITKVRTATPKTAPPVTVNRTVKKVDASQVSRQNKIAESPRQVDNKVVVPKRAEAPRKVEIAKPQPQISQPEPIVEQKITPSVPVNRIKAEPRKEIRESRPERTVPQTPAKETVSEPTVRTDITVSRDRPSRDRKERDFSRRDTRGQKAAEPSYSAKPEKMESLQTVKPLYDRTARSDRRDFDSHKDFGSRRDSTRDIRRPKIAKRDNIVVVNNTIVKNSYPRGHYNVHHRGRIWGHYPRRVFNLVVWPSYYYPVYYGYGPQVVYNYVRPYYHRKYVFVSIGGWWPTYYSSVRYYWYGWHPYNWYGSYPEAYEVTSNTYNYYYYNTDTTGQAAAVEAVPPLAGVDETTFADVREKLAQQAQQEPKPQTSADFLFEDAVNVFENGEYSAAAKALSEAIKVEPDDLVLPFAYAQALFADEQYHEAADVIRTALMNLPPDQQGIFFPRGLYPEDEILFQQIERLENREKFYAGDADLKFLLGYQYLGIGKYEEAEAALKDAAVYDSNSQAVEILLRLIEKVRETSKIDV